MSTDPTSLAYQPCVGERVRVIRDGKIVHTSRNLRGLISHARRAGVSRASVFMMSGAEGMAFVEFSDGAWCRVRFASFIVCRDFFRVRWARWGLRAEVRNSDTFWSFI